jgi:hypothetical protein
MWWRMVSTTTSQGNVGQLRVWCAPLVQTSTSRVT